MTPATPGCTMPATSEGYDAESSLSQFRFLQSFERGAPDPRRVLRLPRLRQRRLLLRPDLHRRPRLDHKVSARDCDGAAGCDATAR
eukprot:6103389-Alexandrium_andersonii.AAC.1